MHTAAPSIPGFTPERGANTSPQVWFREPFTKRAGPASYWLALSESQVRGAGGSTAARR